MTGEKLEWMGRWRSGICLSLTLVAGLLNGCLRERPPGFPQVLMPETMAVHPFSRQIGGNGSGGGIEARIELRDFFGDTAKGYGVFLFEAYRPDVRSGDRRGARMAVWSIDLGDPTANNRYWDHLSRTYRFVLDWQPPSPEPGELRLEVIYNPPEGFGKRLFAHRLLPPETEPSTPLPTSRLSPKETALTGSEPATPVRIILDTDMDGDCDDTAALAVLHALADRGEAEILAVGACGRNPWTPLVIDAINGYYGRGDLPVGVPRGDAPCRPSRFAETVATRCPHSLRSAEEAFDAVDLYRRLLADAEDHSVTFVTIGYHTNIANLLKSPASDGVPDGIELVRRKVDRWVCMGGNFIGSPARDDLSLRNANFIVDPEASVYTISHWPVEVVFAGREVCSVPSGLKVGACLAKTPEDNPVRIAYESYFGGQVQDRHVADVATVLYAVCGLRDYWNIHDTGRMNLHPDTSFEWEEGPKGLQAYLLKGRMPDGQPTDRYIESVLEELLIAPPACR